MCDNNNNCYNKQICLQSYQTKKVKYIIMVPQAQKKVKVNVYNGYGFQVE